jgi:hypothetical protein
MRNFLLSFLAQIIFCKLYSQDVITKKNESIFHNKDLDSLSKLYKKAVIGYWYSSIQNKKSITLWYDVGKVRKDTTIILSQNLTK